MDVMDWAVTLQLEAHVSLRKFVDAVSIFGQRSGIRVDKVCVCNENNNGFSILNDLCHINVRPLTTSDISQMVKFMTKLGNVTVWCVICN
jgi:hypothetical protein